MSLALLGPALIVVGATMAFVAERADRAGVFWLKQSQKLECSFALLAGAFVTVGLFMVLPAPN